MDPINNYLLQFQSALVRTRSESKVLQFLDQILNHHSSKILCDYFIAGEKAFVQKKYLESLQLHMNSEIGRKHHFFIYRSAAFLADQMGKTSKAVAFCDQALKLYPLDFLTLMLSKKLLLATGQNEKAQSVANRIERLAKRQYYEVTENREDLSSYNLAELEGIFQEQTNQELFCK